MPRQRIPKAPWDNGVYDEAEHDAFIFSITRCPYGKGNGFYFRIVLCLDQKKTFLATNIYVRNDTKQSACRRIWHLCQACGKSMKQFLERPLNLSGCPIRVRLTTISPAKSGASKSYSDVDRFLKPEGPVPGTSPASDPRTELPAERLNKTQKRSIEIFPCIM